MNKFNLLPCVSLLSLASGLQAAAQGQTADASNALEELTVLARPLAESAAAALQVQRNSDSLVSVLSADAVGNLPDQNIAYAVGRLPGVAVERDQGQARYINLRGAPVYWTTLSFDGLSVVSPQGRDSRFDNIPSAIASQITVQKAVVPFMAGASVAGNVDIRTRRAYDYDGQTITGKAGMGYVTLGGGKEIDTSLVYSNIFMDGRLGIVAQGSYYSREMATDNWETDPYLSNTIDPSKHFAREHENKHYRLTRYNISGSTRVDYKLDDNSSIFASTIYTLYHDDELRDNFIWRLDQGTDAAGNSYTSNAYINANSPTQGTVYGARINARIDYRDTREKMSTSTLGGERDFGDWDLSWRLNETFTSDGRDTPVTAALQSPSAFNLRPTVDYDFRNGDVNTVRLYATDGSTGARTKGAQVLNIEDFQFPLQTIGQVRGGDITQAGTAKADISYTTEIGGLTTKFSFGGLYTDRKKKSREKTYSRSFTTGTIPTWATLVNGNTIGYLGTQNLNYTFRYTDENFTTDFMNGLISSGQATLLDTSANFWVVNEVLTAGYAMGTTEFAWGNIVYGARVEHIKNTGEAIVAFPAVGTTPAESRLVQSGSSDTLIYPSAHLNWNVTREVKARFGVTTSASRPDFDDLRPNFTINDATQTISGGNPGAKPEKQIGLDAYLEWYMTPTGYLSAGVFYKDISDVLVQTSNQFTLDTLDRPGLDRSSYTYTAIANGGGHLEGLEVAYADTAEALVQRMGGPAWMEGFGVNASATFTSSSVTLPAVNGVPARKINVLGTSDVVYNLQATYEKYGLSVRLAYQWRSPWGQSVGAYRVFNGVTYPVDNGDIFWDSDEEMDLSARYQVTRQIEIFFDGVNLLNQSARRYGDKKIYPIEYEKFGPRYIGGVRFHF